MDIYTDEYFMKQALLQAQEAYDQDEVPVGAVVVCQNKVIARAHNLSERLLDPTAHAEMQAITSASNYLGGKFLIDCTLYVTLEPCVMCAGALYWSRVSRIVFGASDEKRGYARLDENVLHPKTEVKYGVMQNECSEILLDFFQKKRNSI